MNQRIAQLRQNSLDAVESISGERAALITAFYKSNKSRGWSVPVMRARAFYYLLENKALCINDGELIVGERGPAPKATPTYPEITLHSLRDLQLLHSRPKVSFRVSSETRQLYEKEIIPFWNGKTNRDKIFEAMSSEWLTAYEAGIFTEFQEQRAPGHTVAGDKIYRMGMLGIIRQTEEQMEALDFLNDPQAYEKREELKAMRIAAKAIIMYAHRHSEALSQLAGQTADPARKKELETMAGICRRVPAHKPESLHEALQNYWFIHLGVITELNPWDSFSPGRLDQHLYPFYKKEISAGTITNQEVRELLQAFWIKFNNHPSPPKIGVTALESNTYTDFALINLGGITPEGNDAVNELSYLLLDVVEEMRLLQPSSMVQVSKKSPDRFVDRALEITGTGFGQPSLFNSDAIIQQLLLQGKELTDARNGGASGCVETGAFGTESYILTGYFNLNKVLEITLHNGTDPLTGKKTGIETGRAEAFQSFQELRTAFRKQLNYFIDLKIKGNNVIEKIFAIHLPVPFLSLIIDDCIANATDYNAGGARYNTSYIQGVGLGTLTDSLTAIRYHIFDKKHHTMKELMHAVDLDFAGSDDLQKKLREETPKYGNDDDYADAQAVFVFNTFHDAVNNRPTARGGRFRINMLPTTSHIYFGSKTGATPEGRNAHQPFSEGISPCQGTDTKGPTAVLKSAAKIDHLKTGGTLLNQKFSPQFFRSRDNRIKLRYLIRGYFRMDGHHIQFNVVDANTLRDAQKHPEKHRDLIVRVAGYSDYFNNLGSDLQDEIIRRTVHEST